MNIERLREFVCLAKNLNFTAAAQRLYISQSVLSRHISAMEQELGVKLFIRNQQRVRLTAQGKAFLPDAERIIDLYDASVAKVTQIGSDAEEPIRVGYLHGAVHNFLIDACTAFMEDDSTARLKLQAFEHEDLMHVLEKGTVDASFTMTFNIPNPSWYSSYLLFRDYHGIIVSNESHLARRKALALSDLEGETVLIPSLERYQAYSTFLSHAIQSVDASLDLSNDIYDGNDYVTQARARDCIAIIPSHLDQFYNIGGMSFVPLLEEGLTFDVRMVWKTSRETPAFMRFVDGIRAFADRKEPAELRGTRDALGVDGPQDCAAPSTRA